MGYVGAEACAGYALPSGSITLVELLQQFNTNIRIYRCQSPIKRQICMCGSAVSGLVGLRRANLVNSAYSVTSRKWTHVIFEWSVVKFGSTNVHQNVTYLNKLIWVSISHRLSHSNTLGN